MKDNTKRKSTDKRRLPLNYNLCVKEFGDNEEILKSVIKQFFANTDKQLSIFKDLCEKEEWEEFRQQIHKIRGAAANLNAYPVADVAGEIEDEINSKKYMKVNEKLSRLNQVIDELKDYIINTLNVEIS